MHRKYKKKDMTNIEKCNVNVTVVNGHKMKCDLKGSVNMKLKGGETVNMTEVLYLPQLSKNIFSVSRLVLKVSTVEDNQ